MRVYLMMVWQGVLLKLIFPEFGIRRSLAIELLVIELHVVSYRRREHTQSVYAFRLTARTMGAPTLSTTPMIITTSFQHNILCL